MTSRMRIGAETSWYELFSRGGRDWLRHNEKVREAVRDNLLDLISAPDMITHPGERTVRVPVRLLEHARFRLADPASQRGAGQGKAGVGDVLQPGGPEPAEGAEGGGEQGEVKLLVELRIDDIVDWLWDELELPDLQARPRAGIDVSETVREGTGRRGPRARLDRRRTVKEAVKRRAIQPNPVPFTDDDLRFHQLAQRPITAINAVVLFALDASGSMGDAERRLAKTFFFFALQGIRRQYRRVETRFIAHTTQAWEFPEAEFFQVTGTGGTAASAAFAHALALVREHYDPAQYNGYLYYASDGENAFDDRSAAAARLGELARLLNYVGYLETRPGMQRLAATEMSDVFAALAAGGAAVGHQVVREQRDLWQALRRFFVARAGEPDDL